VAWSGGACDCAQPAISSWQCYSGDLVQPHSYFSTWDIAAALHPRPCLATQERGNRWPFGQRAAVPCATEIQLRYKLSKWVTASSDRHPGKTSHLDLEIIVLTGVSRV